MGMGKAVGRVLNNCLFEKIPCCCRIGRIVTPQHGHATQCQFVCGKTGNRFLRRAADTSIVEPGDQPADDPFDDVFLDGKYLLAIGVVALAPELHQARRINEAHRDTQVLAMAADGAFHQIVGADP